jgi:hypothetical protein
MTSKIESFQVTGAAPRFALEHPPVPGSAICSVNRIYLAESAHVIEDDRLIITDPVDTFRGATDGHPVLTRDPVRLLNGNPRLIHLHTQRCPRIPASSRRRGLRRSHLAESPGV